MHNYSCGEIVFATPECLRLHSLAIKALLRMYVHSCKKCGVFYTIRSTLVCSWHFSMEVCSLSIKVWNFFYSTFGVHHNCTLLFHYKMHNIIVTIMCNLSTPTIYTDCAQITQSICAIKL